MVNLVIKLKTVKTPDLDIPRNVPAFADEVIASFGRVPSVTLVAAGLRSRSVSQPAMRRRARAGH